MNKRIISIALALILAITMVSPVIAAEPEPDDINASNYLTAYGAYLYSDGTHGKLKLSYEVYATNYMSSVGVYKIEVRKSNGTLYQTIWGSTSNGLLATNAIQKTGVYTLNVTAGSSYYCKVTVIAEDSAGADTRTVRTGTVACP